MEGRKYFILKLPAKEKNKLLLACIGEVETRKRIK